MKVTPTMTNSIAHGHEIDEELRADLKAMHAAAADRKLRWSRRLSYVPRWSVVPTLRFQSVAEHSFHVAQIAMWLMDRHRYVDHANFRLQVLELALNHDDDEATTGDYPSTTKTSKIPRNQVELVVKIADKLEALAFLAEEEDMGNRRVSDISEEIHAKFIELWQHFDYLDMHPKVPAGQLMQEMLAQILAPHPALEVRKDA